MHVVIVVLMSFLTNIERILTPSQPPSPPPSVGDTPQCGNRHTSRESETSSNTTEVSGTCTHAQTDTQHNYDDIYKPNQITIKLILLVHKYCNIVSFYNFTFKVTYGFLGNTIRAVFRCFKSHDDQS